MASVLNRLLVTAGLLLPTACGGETRPLVATEHVRLFYPPEGGACAGELVEAAEVLEASASAIASFLEVPLPDIEYHLVDAGDWPAGTPCAAYDGGCTDGEGRVHAPGLVPHELVHAITVKTFGGFRASFLDEGLAEALGGSLSDMPVAYPQPIDELLAARRIEPDAYHAAGHFVSYLLARSGGAAMRDLLARAPMGIGLEALGEALDDTHDATPNMIAAEIAARGWSLRGLGVGYCNAAPVLGRDAEAVRSPGCSPLVSAATIDVAGDADHDIAWRGPGASFSLRRCPLSGETVDFFATGSRSVAASAGVAHLRSGRYLLALTGDPLVSTTLSVTAPRAGRACADPMPLSPEDEQLVIAPEAGRTTTRFFVAPSAGARALMLRGSAEVTLCEGCGDACRHLSHGELVALVPGAIYSFSARVAAWGDAAALSFLAP